MPPRPISSMISSWGKSLASSSTVGGVNAGRGDAPVSDSTPLGKPALSKHSGHRPIGAPTASGRWQLGQTRFESILAFQPVLRKRGGKVTEVYTENCVGRNDGICGGDQLLPSRQNAKQMAEFFLHIFPFGHGLRNLGAQQLAVAFAETVHGGFDRALVGLELCGQFSVGLALAAANERGFQRRKQRGLSFALMFVT